MGPDQLDAAAGGDLQPGDEQFAAESGRDADGGRDAGAVDFQANGPVMRE
ncbi:hypothetical protein ACFW93_02800 [Streptomyces canus]